MQLFTIRLADVEGSEAFVHYIKRLIAALRACTSASQWRVHVRRRPRLGGDTLYEVTLRWRHQGLADHASGVDTDMYLAVRNAFATARQVLVAGGTPQPEALQPRAQRPA